MATASKTRNAAASKPAVAPQSRMVKCACASCQCTVDIDRGVRKGNLIFCNQVCSTRCTLEECQCEHDHCAV